MHSVTKPDHGNEWQKNMTPAQRPFPASQSPDDDFRLTR